MSAEGGRVPAEAHQAAPGLGTRPKKAAPAAEPEPFGAPSEAPGATRLSRTSIFALQRTAGNKAVSSLLRVQRQAPAAAPPEHHAIPHEGYQLTADFETMSALLERVVAEKGWDWTESWAYRFINRDKLGDFTLGDPDLVGRITQRLTIETNQMEAKVKGFIGDFEHAATEDTKLLLNNSEKQVKSEAERYGLKVSGYIFKDYSMNDGPLRKGLQDASRELAAKRHHCNEVRRAFFKAQEAASAQLRQNPFIPDTSLTAQLDSARTTWVSAEDEYHSTCQQKQTDYPILAAYTTLDDAASKLDELASQDSTNLAKNLMKTVEDRLNNIETVRDEIGDRFSIWNTPQIMALEKRNMNVQPWQNRVADDHAREVKTASEDQAKVFAAIALGLGLLAAIPTGGSSLLAGVAAAGAALGAAYSMYSLYEHYKDYSLASAETGSAFEKAQAVSQDDPSLIWLASDLLDLGLNVVGAMAAFKALRGAMLAAEASRLEKMPEVINEARSLGLPAEVRGRVIAAVVEATGGTRSVQEALNAILETFNKLTPDVDAELARAYQQAATTIIGEGRLGFASGSTTTEALDEIKRVLKSAGVEDAKLDSYARKIAKQFADDPSMGGGYYSALDIVILREGSPADSLAHELAHRVQNLSGDFSKLSTMRKEYQAFVAEREFLLMLPQDQVPAGFSTDLLRMTNEDIKTYVVKNYTEKILADLRSGTPFDPFDETTDGELILEMFKKNAKRSIP